MRHLQIYSELILYQDVTTRHYNCICTDDIYNVLLYNAVQCPQIRCFFLCLLRDDMISCADLKIITSLHL